MNTFRFLRFGTTIGIGSCLYKSLPDGRKTSIFKVNAQPEEWSFSNIEHSLCAAAASTPKAATRSWAASSRLVCPQSDHPTVDSLRFTGSFNHITGLPLWTLHHVKRTETRSGHACPYCEAVAAGDIHVKRRIDNGPELLDAYLDQLKSYGEYDFDPCVLYTAPPQIHRSETQSNSLWDDLYHYTQFLAKKHPNVYVCSGPLLTSTEFETESGCYSMVTLSHFFKVILTETKHGSYRFECYKIPNQCIPIDHPDLANYRVPRSEIEDDVGFIVFQNIRPPMVVTTEMDPEFCPHWKCAECFPPLTK